MTNELLKNHSCIKENAATVQKEMLLHTQGGNLWTVIEDILRACERYLKKLVLLKYPNNCCSILKATNAGPGVGVTNTKVRFRDIETARIHSSDRVNRIHRAPGDSAQNEAERTNAKNQQH